MAFMIFSARNLARYSCCQDGVQFSSPLRGVRKWNLLTRKLHIYHAFRRKYRVVPMYMISVHMTNNYLIFTSTLWVTSLQRKLRITHWFIRNLENIYVYIKLLRHFRVAKSTSYFYTHKYKFTYISTDIINRRVAGNIYNKQSRTADKGWSSTLGCWAWSFTIPRRKN